MSTLNSELNRLKKKLDRLRVTRSSDERKRKSGFTAGLLPEMSIFWCLGTWFGLDQEIPVLSGWIIMFVVLATMAVVVRRNRFKSRVMVVLATATLAGARASSYVNSVPEEIIPIMGIADGRIVNVQGRICDIDDQRVKPIGLLERYGRTDTSRRIDLDALSVKSPGGQLLHLDHPIAVIIQTAEGTGLPFQRGQLICFRARIHRSREPTSPQGFTARPPRIWMDVPDLQLIRCVDSSRSTWFEEPLELVRFWRLAARDALENSLTWIHDERSRQLVMAIVLGVREQDFNTLSLPYRRTGLAHYLAVSGFAFGVLVAMPRFITTGRSHFLKTLVVITVIILGLSAIDIRSPALRAGLIAASTALGIGLRREWNRASLLGLTCIILLAIEPQEILNPGFQLSFSVVAALLVLTPALRKRFMIRTGDGLFQMIRSWITQACLCGVVAWVSATPLVIHHFGVVSTTGVILSVLAAPLVAAIVIMAVLAILLALFSTTLSQPAGALSAGMTWVLDRSACLVSELPGTCIVMPMTSMTWMVCAEVVAWRWFLHRRRSERFLLAVASVFLVIVPFITEATRPQLGSIRVQTLDVGDGTCHMVTGPGGTVLMDGGSSSVRSCAARILLPALRELGIKSIDSIIITHANLDHYSAVGDLFGRIPIRRLLLGRSFLEQSEEDPAGAASELIRLAEVWSIPIETVTAGDELMIGGLVWRFLHPEHDQIWQKENDRSLVTRVQDISSQPGDPAAILFTGDIEEAAMSRLIEQKPGLLRARILEVPHHGSVRPSTGRFIECVNPEIILQSTGSRRLLKDELGSVIGDRVRACTAECGSITVMTRNGLVTGLHGFTRDPSSHDDVHNELR